MTTTSVFAGWPDLVSSDLGGAALLSSDAFFAGHDNLVKPSEPVFLPDEYTDLGKWMDGWEPRRRRSPGHDWCILRLGVPGDLVGVDIDTRHFLGNHAPYGRLDATVAPADASPEWLRDHGEWTPVLDQVPLQRGGHNAFAVRPFAGATHVRLSIYPAGGVARLRVHGRPRAPSPPAGERVDLASVRIGGRALACSDMFFSRMDNLLLPTEAPTMGHGWETKRSPLPREDWVVLALGAPGRIDTIVLDTRHFKGNYPESARVEAVCWPDAEPWALTKSAEWQTIAGPARLSPDDKHALLVADDSTWTHLRLVIESDGGISRLRAVGEVVSTWPAESDPQLIGLNDADVAEVQAAFLRCCGSARWAQRMAAARPFRSRTHFHGVAEQVWWHLGDGDWHEAFTHHPRIGADVEALRAKYAAADWSASEQAGMSEADSATIEALAAGNQAYERRYGHIFIVCASGLSAGEMLARLDARMANSAEVELRNAAGEQAKITRIRLDKLEVPR
ncbi:MAG: allantoicase [Myxococcota bacterium]|jgi:allantoicase